MTKILHLLPLLLLLLFSSCSINRMAINAVSDALTGTDSGNVFSSDPDPELVGDALPFAIKMYEALLDSNPNHQGLILTTGSLFIMYANAFVQTPAEMLPAHHFAERSAANERAKMLYLRGVDILYRDFDNRFPGFSTSHQDGSYGRHLARMRKQDVPLLYWTVAGNMAAFALDPFNLALGQRIPKLTAMLQRAYELDPDFNNGALDEFYILFYGSLPELMGGNKELAEKHFRIALEKNRGLSAGTYLSYVRAIAIPAQDYDTFKEYLGLALAIDVDADPPNRLVNILSQRTAAHLLSHASDIFFLLDDDDWDDDWDDWVDEDLEFDEE